MKFFTVDLKAEFPQLSSSQNPTLTCYVNDMILDRQPDRYMPAMLICPGGGYCSVCYSREGEPIAFHYMRMGYSAFALTYSITPEHYPQQLLEAACAMLYIRRHAEEWHIDASKIAINGYSAGGHLAASLGVFWNDPFICDMLKTSPETIRPDAMVLGYPVISADPSFSHAGSIQNLTGTADTEAPIYKKMSLETHVKQDTPPTFLWHTAEDACVPVKNSIAFASALAENRVQFELHVYPYGWHGLATADEVTNGVDIKNSPAYYCRTWIDESIKFLASLGF